MDAEDEYWSKITSPRRERGKRQNEPRGPIKAAEQAELIAEEGKKKMHKETVQSGTKQNH